MTEAPGRAVSYIREGFHTITPYLIIAGAARWIDFMKRRSERRSVFGLKVRKAARSCMPR